MFQTKNLSAHVKFAEVFLFHMDLYHLTYIKDLFNLSKFGPFDMHLGSEAFSAKPLCSFLFF